MSIYKHGECYWPHYEPRCQYSCTFQHARILVYVFAGVGPHYTGTCPDPHVLLSIMEVAVYVQIMEPENKYLNSLKYVSILNVIRPSGISLQLWDKIDYIHR